MDVQLLFIIIAVTTIGAILIARRVARFLGMSYGDDSGESL